VNPQGGGRPPNPAALDAAYTGMVASSSGVGDPIDRAKAWMIPASFMMMSSRAEGGS
jgi:hypothetical protein